MLLKIKNYLKIKNFKVKITLLVLMIFLFVPKAADASLLFSAPNYLGLTDGLVGSWSFNAPDLAGVTAYDRSGNGNNGTLTNGPTRTIGKIGQALNFDGVDDYVALPSNLLSTGPVTISSWVKTSVLDLSSDIIVDLENTVFTVRLVNNQFQIVAWDGGTKSVTTNLSLVANRWYHLVAVGDGTNLIIYVDGKNENSAASGIPIFSSFDRADAIGANHIGTDSFFNGLIDEVRVYNRALSADEIKRLYNIGSTLKVNKPVYNDSLTSGLVGSWSFNAPDIFGVTAYDRSGNSNNGTLTGGPTRQIGKIGQALNFDGVDDYVSGPDISALFPNQEATFAVWVKLNNHTPTEFRTGSWFFNVSDSNNHYVWIDGIIYDGSFKTTRETIGAGIITDRTQWHHVAITRKAGANGWKFYQNGTEIYSADGGTWQIGTSFKIGESDSTSYNVDGSIDEVRVYNRALSAEEIKRLYNIGATLKVNKPAYNDSLTTGLVGSWSFNAGDLAGVTAYDRSGNGNNGTLTNGPTRQIGKIGQALNFDGSDDFVDLGTSATLQPAKITIAAWINTTNRALNQTIASKTDSTDNQGWALRLDSGNLEFILDDTTKGSFTAPSANAWHATAGTYDGTNIRIYVDGVLVNTTASAAYTTSVRSGKIGARTSGGVASNFFSGLIDEVRVYNRALSADEIKRLYNMGR